MSAGKELMALAVALVAVLLVGPPSATLLTVSAQYGTTRTCGAASVTFRTSLGFEYDEYRRVLDRMEATKRECPRGMVCAQKLTVVENGETVYSEDCWPDSIQEYTEVACRTDLCNGNLTFGIFPNFGQSYHSGKIKCYNHGQINGRGHYRTLLSNAEYQRQNRNPQQQMPVSDWGNGVGMCGAAVYASNNRRDVVHERVLTGDRNQKFAMLLTCKSTGCETEVLQEAMSRGFRL